jgi:hypothetical protein
MKVRELIEQLSRLNPNVEVLITVSKYDEPTEETPVTAVTLLEVGRDDHGNYLFDELSKKDAVVLENVVHLAD